MYISPHTQMPSMAQGAGPASVPADLKVRAMDLVLDPGAVALGFWQYPAGGVVWGVPVMNFAGWLLSAGTALAIADRSLDRGPLTRRLQSQAFMLDDLASFTILWGVVAAWFGLWMEVVVSVIFGPGMFHAGRFDAGMIVPAWRPWAS